VAEIEQRPIKSLEQRMTYTQLKKSEYRALILMYRAWRESYRILRAHNFDRTAACELANLTVTMG